MGYIDQAKMYVHDLIRTLGYSLEKLDRDRPPPPAFNHPMEAVYHTLVDRRPAAVECDLSDCVTFNGLGYGQQNWHPFVSFLRQYREDHTSTYDGSALQQYYQLWQPAHAAEALARAQNLDNRLRHENRFSYIQPWRTKSPNEIYMRRQENVRQFGASYEYEDMTLEEDGMFLQGPLSPRKGEIEVHRLVTIYSSIAENGYVRSGHSGGDINGLILKMGGAFRYLVISGHHRAAALTALGHESVPVRPVNSLIVEDRHVDYWPQVQRGEVWDRASALEYMRFLFENDWSDWACHNHLPTY